MCKIRDVSELYALADKCARAEEGRRLPGENVGAGGSDSEDAAPARKNQRRNNRKRKGKEVLVVEQSGNGGGDSHLRGNLLAGVTSFGFLGATSVAGLLDN